MKKIIAAVDALHFSEKELLHYNTIAKQIDGKLHIIFLENIFYESSVMAGMFSQEAYSYYAEINWEHIEQRRKLIAEKAMLFYKSCKEYGIAPTLHEENGIPLQDIIKESRFADLLLVNNTTTFATLIDSDPPKFVKDVLRQAECPVLVLPPEQKEVNELVLTYNGGFSAMYAIKQFTSLFKNYSTKKVTVLFVDEENTGKVKDEPLIKDYLQHHFSNWEIKRLTGNPAFEISAYVLRHSGCIVTMGAYGRSKLSQFFHHSDAEKMLQTVNTYAFITHS
jgi:nucleotide-binding universal stress UspA family protein